MAAVPAFGVVDLCMFEWSAEWQLHFTVPGALGGVLLVFLPLGVKYL